MSRAAQSNAGRRPPFRIAWNPEDDHPEAIVESLRGYGLTGLTVDDRDQVWNAGHQTVVEQRHQVFVLEADNHVLTQELVHPLETGLPYRPPFLGAPLDV